MTEEASGSTADSVPDARGFRDRSRLADVRADLLDAIVPVDDMETVPVAEADGRVLAGSVIPRWPVPHYERAAVDGHAVVAESTFGASARSPNVLAVGDCGDPVDSRTAVPVHAGSEIPEGANAVVTVENAEIVGDEPDGVGELEVAATVTPGENVSRVGEDVAGDADLFGDAHRLRPPDLGLLRSVGHATLDVYPRPTVDVIPTGTDLVDVNADRVPDPGEVVETNALVVLQYVESWGATTTEQDVVPSDVDRLREAVDRGTSEADLVVTIGGTSVGERDRVAEVVADAGRVLHHGLAIEPGHSGGVGVVDDTPILMLPGSPVSCIVTTHALLRPALERAGHLSDVRPSTTRPSTTRPSTTRAMLARKVASEPGVRQYVRVSLRDGDDGPEATPIRAKGASALSSVTDADGWVVVPESSEGIPAGDTVDVEDWEYRP